MATWNYLCICLLPVFSPTQEIATSICTTGMSIPLCLLYCIEPFTKKNIQSGAKGSLPPKENSMSLNFTGQVDTAAWYGMSLRILTLCKTAKQRTSIKDFAFFSYGWFKESCTHSLSCDFLLFPWKPNKILIKTQKHFYRNKYKWKMW